MWKQLSEKSLIPNKFRPQILEAKPARIPPQTPPAGGKRVEAKRKIKIPRKKDFRFAESALKPHHLPDSLRAESRRKMSFPFLEKISPPPNQKCKEHFFCETRERSERW